jgi:DNA-binding NarL/FixJ family response regulator
MTESSERIVTFRGPAEPGDRVLVVDRDRQLADDTASALITVGLSASAMVSANDALDVAPRYRPTVLITDIDLEVELGGLRLADAIRRRWGAAAIVMSGRTDSATIGAIAAASPFATLYKPLYWRQLELTVRLAIAGRSMPPAPPAPFGGSRCPNPSRADLEDSLRRIAFEVSRTGFAIPQPGGRYHELLHTLRPRQREIVMLLLQHHRVPAIARLLSLRPATVRNHLKKVFKRLGVRSQQDLLMRLQDDDTRTAT